MTKYSTTRSTTLRSVTKKSTKSYLNFSKKNYWTALVSIVLIFAFGVYLFEINNMSTQGYQIRELEKQISELSAENKKMELDLVEYRSMSYLSNKMAELDLVEGAEITYISGGRALAQR